MDAKVLEALAANAVRLRELGSERDEAFAEEQQGEAAVLDTAVDAVRPALGMLCSSIEESGDPNTSVHLKHPRTKKAARGVVLSAVPWGWNGEETTEEKLYLLEDGTWLFHQLTADDAVNGTIVTTRTDEGGAEFFDDTLSFVRKYGRRFRAETLVEKLNSIVEAQLNGGITKRTQEARERAARLQAIALLSKGPGKPEKAPAPGKPGKMPPDYRGPYGLSLHTPSPMLAGALGAVATTAGVAAGLMTRALDLAPPQPRQTPADARVDRQSPVGVGGGRPPAGPGGEKPKGRQGTRAR